MFANLASSTSESLTFRPLQASDLPLMHRWLSEEHIVRWWGGCTPTLEEVESKYGPSLVPNSLTTLLMVELAGRPIGIGQFYLHADYPQWDKAVAVDGAAGIDYFIGEADCLKRGLGSRMLREMAALVLSALPTATSVVAVPQADNRASCQALSKAGFRLLRIAQLESDDPSDSGPSAIYVHERISP